MRLIPAVGAIAVLVSTTAAQLLMSDADVATIRSQLVNIVAQVGTLDTIVTAYTGSSDNDALLAGSEDVITAIDTATNAITPLQGSITVTQAATQLLDQVNALNSIVATTTQDIQNQKPLLVVACLGVDVLDQVNQQLAAAWELQFTISLKFDDASREAVLTLSQPSINSLTQAVQTFADQTSLPASCVSYPDDPLTTSSPVPLPPTSSAPSPPPPVVSTTSAMPLSSRASSISMSMSMMTSVASNSMVNITLTTTTTTRVCTRAGCSYSLSTMVASKPSQSCPSGQATAVTTAPPARYTGGAVAHFANGLGALAAFGLGIVVAL